MIPIDLSGKTCLITGGTRGIGAAISSLAAQAGASTIAVYRSNESAAAESLAERQAFGGRHCNHKADISVPADVDALAARVTADFDSLHGLVLGAGVPMHRHVMDITNVDWQRVIDTNLTSALLMVRALQPLMTNGGSIVSIASGAGHDGLPGLAAYGASKAGLILFTQSIAQDLGPDGIRANVVSPGFVDTEFSGVRADDSKKQRIAANAALRRHGVPADVAGAVLFFLSDLSSFVTGQALRVNGGVV